MRRQVELTAEAIGTPVQLKELSEEDFRALPARGMPEHMVDAVLDFLAFARQGGSPVTSAAEEVLGRTATPFAHWASDHADEFR